MRLRLRKRRSRPARRQQEGGAERVLFRFFGPAQVGPYDSAPAEKVDALCPKCGRPYSEHEIDRSTGRSFIRCPEP